MAPDIDTHDQQRARSTWKHNAARFHQGGHCDTCGEHGSVARQPRRSAFECFPCFQQRTTPTRRRRRRPAAVAAEIAAAALIVLAGFAIAPDDQQPAHAATRQVTARQIDQAINHRFGKLAPVMRCVARYESTYHELPTRAITVVGPTSDFGVFQIHVFAGDTGRWIYGRFYPIAVLKTLDGNLDAAWRLLTRAGRGGPDLNHWNAQKGRCF